ncbi:MAG: hypothetical protein LBE02_07925 [Spirochaetaceae bacterium]|jgi:molybdenum cofactor biosynthesis enzyme MoaA|nr:hypothetical protein [Spirochaetaceae bacterium]
MKENRLSSVQASLYSMEPEIHDSIANLPGSFIKTRNAIQKLIKNDIPVQISCPVMKQNKNCSVDVLNWGQAHKIRTVTDYIMMARYDHTTGNLDNRLSLEEVAAAGSAAVSESPVSPFQSQRHSIHSRLYGIVDAHGKQYRNRSEGPD